MKRNMVSSFSNLILPALLLILSPAHLIAQEFSIGWANMGTRYICNTENFDDSNRDFLSPGFEMQLNYSFSRNWALTSGLNHHTLFFKTEKDKYFYYDILVPSINTATIRELRIPLLLKYNFAKYGIANHFNIISGIYYVIPLFEQYTEEKEVPGPGGYYTSSIREINTKNYSFLYLGCGIEQMISDRVSISAELFGSYQLNETYSSNEVRNRFWYGLKVGINYSFKNGKDEN